MIPVIMRVQPCTWLQGLVKMKRHTFIEKLQLAEVEDVIVSNSKEDLGFMQSVVEDPDFVLAKSDLGPVSV